MSVEIVDLKVEPYFDLMYFMSVCGETRMEHGLVESLGPKWDAWVQHVNAKKLISEHEPGGKPEERKGYLLVWLDKAVEDAVEESWQTEQKGGLAAHNLAISLVMSAAISAVPEIGMGCAPLPKPDGPTQAAFKRLGLEWNADGTVNRTYAVFTPHPFSGGCELCFKQETCMHSGTRDLSVMK